MVVDHASHVVLSDLSVHDVGEEAVHLRSFSSDDTVERLVIRRTGLRDKKFGEGSGPSALAAGSGRIVGECVQ